MTASPLFPWIISYGRKVEVDRLVLLSDLPADQLRLGHFLDGVLRTLPPRAAELDTPVGHLVDPILRYLVDHESAHMDPLGCPERLVNVASVDAGLEAVFGIVDLGNGLIQR